MRSYSPKNILVTGGAGFLGSHLTHRLLEAGHVVHVLDNQITSTQHLLDITSHQDRFNFHVGDVRDPFEIDHVDEIYHMASLASPQHYLKHPILTWETSVLGTRHMLHLAQKHKAKLLFTSTSECYGDPLVHPQPETYWGNVNPVGPRSCYDEGKRAAETLCYEFSKLGVDVRVVRIFNTFGPYMNVQDGRVVTEFIAQALQGAPLPIFGTGHQTRCLCYISDMIDGLMRMMAHTPPLFGPMNLGSEEEICVVDLANKILHLTGSKSELQFLTLPQDDPQNRKPDIAFAKHVLNWSPKITLDKGLADMIAHMSSRNHPTPL